MTKNNIVYFPNLLKAPWVKGGRLTSVHLVQLISLNQSETITKVQNTNWFCVKPPRNVIELRNVIRKDLNNVHNSVKVLL